MSLALVPPQERDEELPLEAEKLDAILYSLSRVRTVTERILGRGLMMLSQNEGLLRLSYANLNDYVCQCLGIGERFAQELRTLETRLPSYPLVAAAYEQGTLCKSKVRALIAAIRPEEEALWVSRAQDLTVRQLNAALKAGREAKNPPASQPNHPDDCTPNAGPVAEYLRPLDADLHPRSTGSWVCVEASPNLEVKFKLACDIEQRRAGYDMPHGLCVEAFCSEFFSSPVTIDVMGEVADEVERMLEDNEVVHARRKRTRERAMAAAERWSGQWDSLPRTILHALPPAELLAPLPEDPFDIDRRLREVIAYLQQHSYRFMEVLTIFKRRGTYRRLGFRNLEQYTVERLGMSRTCVDALVRLHEKLDSMPHTAQAFYSGCIHQTQAQLLTRRVVTPESERRWLEFAQDVPTRVLQEKIQNLTNDGGVVHDQ